MEHITEQAAAYHAGEVDNHHVNGVQGVHDDVGKEVKGDHVEKQVALVGMEKAAGNKSVLLAALDPGNVEQVLRPK